MRSSNSDVKLTTKGSKNSFCQNFSTDCTKPLGALRLSTLQILPSFYCPTGTHCCQIANNKIRHTLAEVFSISQSYAEGKYLEKKQKWTTIH
jgi:hypothetical protein